jgi:amino acid adenylation domain-containing protein
MIEAQVVRTPDVLAVADMGRTLTYHRLNRQANQIAHRLRRVGVGPGTVVGIAADRSVDLVAGLLGIVKAGGAYVPLDPTYPAERLRFMLEDSGAVILVTLERLGAARPRSSTPRLCLDADAELLAGECEENPVPAATADDLAYVIYTSGSTGRPKGVEVPHRALVNLLTSMRDRPGLSDRDILLSLTTIAFDIAGLEVYLPLTVGGRVVMASREATLDGARLAALLAMSGATVMQATPATWRLLLDAGWRPGPAFKILCGGEALAPALAARLLGTGASVWNLYGPTETTIWSTVHEVQSPDGPVPIGRPIANTRVYVLDAQGQVVPVGVAGELHIGGSGVARGYRRRPDLTAERFVPDPFSGEPGARLYRTGDLVRSRADGALEFLGRKDHQVKVRGFRVELGEIEAALASHPAVREAVVTAWEAAPGDRRLAAYLAAPAPPSVDDLREFLGLRLPDYMVPSTFTFVEAFPLTLNGKVDRLRLPPPEALRPQLRAAYAAPRTEVERIITAIWEKLLAVSDVGVHDDFFQLGGHSLLVIQVLSRLHDELQVDVPVRAMFEVPTIAGLAEWIGALRAEATGDQPRSAGADEDREEIEL